MVPVLVLLAILTAVDGLGRLCLPSLEMSWLLGWGEVGVLNGPRLVYFNTSQWQ